MRQAEGAGGGGHKLIQQLFGGSEKYLARRGGGGVREGSFNLGTQIKMYPAPSTTPDPPDDK